MKEFPRMKEGNMNKQETDTKNERGRLGGDGGESSIIGRNVSSMRNVKQDSVNQRWMNVSHTEVARWPEAAVQSLVITAPGRSDSEC